MNASKKRPAPTLYWAGLTGAEAEEVLTRCFGLEDRAKRYANAWGERDRPELSQAKRVGLVAAHVLEVAREIVKRDGDGERSFPNNKQFSTHLNLGSDSQTTKLLKGAGSDKKWAYSSAKSIMRFAILGVKDGKPDKSAVEAWNRISDVFFGIDWDEGDVPRYFRGGRSVWPAPWSRRELADELRRVAGYTRLHPDTANNAGVTIVASGETIAAAKQHNADGGRRLVPDALREIASRVPVTLICPKGSVAEREFMELMKSVNDPSNLLRLRTAELDAGDQPTRGDFFVPTSEFVYIERPSSDPDRPIQEFLYQVRSRLYDRGDTDLDGVAIATQRHEREMFVQWLKGLQLNEAELDTATSVQDDDPADGGPPVADQSDDRIDERRKPGA